MTATGLTLRDYVGELGRFRRSVVRRIRRTVADELEAYAERTGVDGFNIAYHVTPGSFVDVADHLIPELRGVAGPASAMGDDAAAAAVSGDSARCPKTIPARPFAGKESRRFDT